MAQPPFKVRNAKQINDELGSSALPGDIQAVPIFVFNNDDIHDDASYDGCPYIGDTEDSRLDDEVVY